MTDITDEKQQVLSFFNSHQLGVLSTRAQDNDQPETAVVYYTISDNFEVRFVTRTGTRKFDNIQANGAATLTVFEESILVFAELQGTAEVLTDPAEVSQTLAILQTVIADQRASYWVPPIAQLSDEQYVIISIRPQNIRFLGFDGAIEGAPKLITWKE